MENNAGVKPAYSKAWDKYKNSSDYHKNMTILFEKGILNPYSQNILRSAFDAGYNSHPASDSGQDITRKLSPRDVKSVLERLVDDIDNNTVSPLQSENKNLRDQLVKLKDYKNNIITDLQFQNADLQSQLQAEKFAHGLAKAENEEIKISLNKSEYVNRELETFIENLHLGYTYQKYKELERENEELKKENERLLSFLNNQADLDRLNSEEQEKQWIKDHGHEAAEFDL